MTQGSESGSETKKAKPSRLWAWVQLLRAPNLLTVPGDPLAGALLALAAGVPARGVPLRLAIAGAVSLLLYSAGLLWNDWFDLAEDRRDRPHRPLPAGLVHPGKVALAANVMVAGAVALAALTGQAALYVAVVLGACVLAYNAFAKRIRLLGPLLMGACRGLSVLLGAAAMAPDGLLVSPVGAHAAGTLLYIAAVTWLASGETRRRPVGLPLAAISIAALVWLSGLLIAAVAEPAPYRPSLLPFMAYFGWASLFVLWLVAALLPLIGRPSPDLVQSTVGKLICGLVLAQAAAAALTGTPGLYVAVALTACAVANSRLAKRFYAS